MTASRSALIIGDTGQDGVLLAADLRRRGWAVTGLNRSRASAPDGRVTAPIALEDAAGLRQCVATVRPHHLYYLAAFHGSADARGRADTQEALQASIEVNLRGLANTLAAVSAASPTTRLVYASSSHIFGQPPAEAPQSEATPVRPLTPYAITKVAAMDVVRLYRRQGVHAATAILYNHESPLRAPDYVTQKIATAAAEISLGRRTGLALRNCWARTDWGAASDYVRAMTVMLDAPDPDEFIVASGVARYVADFAEVAFRCVGLDWRDHVTSEVAGPDASALPQLCGDSRKLQAATGWRPLVDFETLVADMVKAALQRLQSPGG